MTFIEAKDAKEAVDKVVQVIKGREVIGQQRADKALKNTKIVIAQVVKDWVKPYSNVGSCLPIVIFSTHPRFKTGTRLDYGFHSILYKQGYTLVVLGLAKREVGRT